MEKEAMSCLLCGKAWKSHHAPDGRCHPDNGVKKFTPGASKKQAQKIRARKRKAPSRSERWMDAAQRASDALQELVDMQSDFENWKDNLPENLQSSALGDKLETICGIDIQSALDAAQEAVDAEIPLGFGRD